MDDIERKLANGHEYDSAYALIALPFNIISAVISVILLASLITPLILYKRHDANDQQHKNHKAHKITRKRKTSYGDEFNYYSPFNYYAIYISSFELIRSTMELITLVVAFQEGNGNTLDSDDATLYTAAYIIREVANTFYIYFDAVVVYELFKLIKSCKTVTRYKPPTGWIITKQALAVFVVSLFAAGIEAFLLQPHYVFDSTVDIVYLAFTSIVEILIPLIFVTVICVKIKRKGCLSLIDDSTKELWLFFLRILIIFLGFYVPAVIMWGIGYGIKVEWITGSKVKAVTFDRVAETLLAIKPTFSVVFMTCTKSDVRKYVFDFISLRYWKKSQQSKNTSSSTEVTEEETNSNEENEHTGTVDNNIDIV